MAPSNPATMTLEILPAREAIARQGGVVHLALRVTPAAVPGRRPVALAIVVDASGSMAEAGGRGAEGSAPTTKLRYVKEAAHFLIDLLGDGDQLCLAAFDEAAYTLLPPVRVGSIARQDLHAAIEKLGPGGNTNLAAGLALGASHLQAIAASGRGARLVLLSDGEANAGETRPEALAGLAAEAARHGVTVSTLGVGYDYQAGLLRAVADAGGGDFHHVESPRSVEQALIEELFSAVEVTARAVSVDLTVAPPATIFGVNLNGYPEVASAATVRVRIGDLARARDVVFEIATPVDVGGDVLVATAVASGSTAAGEVTAAAELRLRVVAAEEAAAAGEDVEVIALVARLLQARAETLVAAMHEAGDVPGARAAIGDGRLAFSRMTRSYSARSLRSTPDAERLFDDLDRRLASGSFDRAAGKALFMRGQATQRSRGRPGVVPFDRSYWVRSPVLLAGCYPGDEDPALAARKLRGLAGAGIRTIVCLLGPGEAGHGGRSLRPYAEEAVRLGLDVAVHGLPERGAVAAGAVEVVLDAVDGFIAAGRPGYVHCLEGRGRTGMVIGCWLVRHGAAGSESALRRLASLRQDLPDARLASPQTPQQARLVRSWRPGL